MLAFDDLPARGRQRFVPFDFAVAFGRRCRCDVGGNFAARRGAHARRLAIAAFGQNLELDLIFVEVELLECRIDCVVYGGTAGLNACHVSSPCPALGAVGELHRSHLDQSLVFCHLCDWICRRPDRCPSRRRVQRPALSTQECEPTVVAGRAPSPARGRPRAGQGQP